jgi:hypothetical protein
MARHVILCGDSILDNAAYVDDGPDVAAQLRGLLDEGDTVTLLAIDGSIAEGAVKQLADISSDATHIIVSTGGNDILHHAALLEQPVSAVAGAMAILTAAVAEFAPNHRLAVEAAWQHDLPVAFCTIYDANMGPLITTAMSIFNDAITRNVHGLGLDLIDLRITCSEAADYANPIEPSVQGGAKIAAAITRYVEESDARAQRTRVFI